MVRWGVLKHNFFSSEFWNRNGEGGPAVDIGRGAQRKLSSLGKLKVCHVSFVNYQMLCNILQVWDSGFKFKYGPENRRLLVACRCLHQCSKLRGPGTQELPSSAPGHLFSQMRSPAGHLMLWFLIKWEEKYCTTTSRNTQNVLKSRELRRISASR